MENQQLDRVLNVITAVMNLTGKTWFLSFGSLLNIVRDNGALNQDIDLSCFYEDKHSLSFFENNLLQYNFKITETVTFDGAPLKITIRPEEGGLYGSVNIDVFFWFGAGDYYYHTYNINRKEKLQNGNLPTYICKGTPKTFFAKNNCFQYQWPGTRKIVNIPLLYGTLLDYWYPNWIVPQDQFGEDSTSMTQAKVEVQSISDLMDRPMNFGGQVHKSKQEYAKYISRIPGHRRV